MASSVAIPVFLAAVALSGTAALAESLEAFLDPVPGARACWERVYSRDHLDAHPDQKVTAMRLTLSYEVFEGLGDYYFAIAAATRDHPRPLDNAGFCFPDDERGPTCAIECDGGAVVLKPAKEDGSILVDLEQYGFISLGATCGDGEQEDYLGPEAEPDDKVFLLHRKGAFHCLQSFAPPAR